MAATPAADRPFVPALIVVDFQQDFCPPSGALAVPDARSIAPHVNALLALPFAVRLATRDWHPLDHVSFAANHPGPPARRPFVDRARVANPLRAAPGLVGPDPGPDDDEFTLWPVHCVQDSPGAALVPELRADRLDAVVDKGTDPRVEMYSAFRDPFGVEDSGVAARLARRRVSHVFVVGLAADYCVKATAGSAQDLGFTTYIVDEATRAVYPDKWPRSADDILKKGVAIISMDGPEVARVKAMVPDQSPQ
ncbi:hypothetical protein HIM_01984 [Hirsutella minnesotensis 3608]|nr:hypothetical protein HIM_01984 [Hirsutella minnesotensis 3608]